ncbi:alpha-galactosidase [Microbacterium sp. Au-Mic1]|uniref:alpha-galactosidase n=1 Tax=Microbacterium sp. Au-Mic1 TaxID=2906457 RepID=UPI001E48C098|nr:alpha-galactosidase [Microbacterium sp. Au-Mic1]MCE4027499.1 alpha-galactosidase [Microbacterium sp. Au-Mic1]
MSSLTLDGHEASAGTVDLGIVLETGGVALVLDIRDGGLPVVVHWGASCGPLDDAGFEALALSGVFPDAGSEVDAVVPVSVLPELSRGWSGTPGISGSRDGAHWSPRFRVTGVAIDGAPVGGQGPSDPSSGGRLILSSGPASVRVTALDDEARLTLALDIELTGSGAIRTRAAVRNRGDDVYRLESLMPTLPVPLDADEALDFAGRWAVERVPQRRRLGVGAHRRENRRGRTGLGAAMALIVGRHGFDFSSGEAWGIHVGWSGNHVHQVERVAEGRQVLAGGELLLPGEGRLAPGEEYATPWLYGFYGGGLDALAVQSHRMLRARPQHPRTARPVTLNVWEAVYFDQNEEDLIELADAAAAVGVERFVLDDGWFGARRNDRAGLGDWTVSAEVWPHGLHPLIDHVRGLGMQFGLWVEPEMVNPDSDLARAHPEWIMSARSEWPLTGRHQQVLDLANPDCYAHIRDALLALLDEYDIAYLKWDHNRDLVEAGSGPRRAPGVHGQTAAFYRLVDDLKSRHPGLEIESCSSGGGRVDLGVLERTDRVWGSDDNDPLERQRINAWTAQLIPPELIGAHIASAPSHVTGRTHTLAFRASVALFGHLGVEADIRGWDDDERAQLAGWIALHKRERALLHSGRMVRAETPDPAFALQGVIAEDAGRALYLFTALAVGATASAGRFRLPGLDDDRRYRVEIEPLSLRGLKGNLAAWQGEGVVLTGRVLGRIGIVMPSVHPETALIVRATAVG